MVGCAFVPLQFTLHLNYFLHEITSSNINELIRSVLKFYFLFFFYKKILQVQKSTKPLTANKNKKMRIKTSNGKKSLIRLFAFYSFARLCFYASRAF